MDEKFGGVPQGTSSKKKVSVRANKLTHFLVRGCLELGRRVFGDMHPKPYQNRKKITKPKGLRELGKKKKESTVKGLRNRIEEVVSQESAYPLGFGKGVISRGRNQGTKHGNKG